MRLNWEKMSSEKLTLFQFSTVYNSSSRRVCAFTWPYPTPGKRGVHEHRHILTHRKYAFQHNIYIDSLGILHHLPQPYSVPSTLMSTLQPTITTTTTKGFNLCLYTHWRMGKDEHLKNILFKFGGKKAPIFQIIIQNTKANKQNRVSEKPS